MRWIYMPNSLRKTAVLRFVLSRVTCIWMRDDFSWKQSKCETLLRAHNTPLSNLRISCRNTGEITPQDMSCDQRVNTNTVSVRFYLDGRGEAQIQTTTGRETPPGCSLTGRWAGEQITCTVMDVNLTSLTKPVWITQQPSPWANYELSTEQILCEK